MPFVRPAIWRARRTQGGRPVQRAAEEKAKGGGMGSARQWRRPPSLGGQRSLVLGVLLLLATGCGSWVPLRVVVRDGPAPTVRLVDTSEVKQLGGDPIEGAAVQWAYSGPIDRSGPLYTRSDGAIEPVGVRAFPPPLLCGDLFISCSKAGHSQAWGLVDLRLLDEWQKTVLILLPRLAVGEDAGEKKAEPPGAVADTPK